jgi:GT2 family glycosyltransferase
MNRVAIVVLNWNGIEDTLECLKSLEKQTYSNFRVVIIDNGSNDDSKSKLDTYSDSHPEFVDIIYKPKNLGFAGGANVGIRWAMKNGFDSVALFNNDAVADKNWLSELVDAAKANDVAICTGLLLHEDGKTIDSTGDWYSSWGLPFPRNRNDITDKAAKAGYVFSASGGASLYSVDLFKSIGLFDEDFFAYYEDTDISFRAQLAGFKIYYTPKAIAYHKQGATSGKIPGFAVYQTFKNLPLLYLKNVPRGLLFSVGIRFRLAYTLILINAIKNKNGVPALRGSFAALKLSFKATRTRRTIQTNKKVSVDYIQSIMWPDLPPDQTGLRKFRKLFTGK